MVLRAPVPEIEIGRPKNRDRGHSLRHHTQRRRIPKRQGPQQHGVYDAEDRGIGSDPDCERQHRDRGKTGILQKHAKSVTQILPKKMW